MSVQYIEAMREERWIETLHM